MPKAESTPAESMEAFLSGIGAKDRLNIEKHLTAVDAEGGPGHGRAWRQIATALRRLAPHAVQTVGQQVVQFFIADGKYRMQVFTLEDRRDGTLLVYLPDVLTEAVRAKVLAKPAAGRGAAGDDDAAAGVQAVDYPIVAKKGEMLAVEALTGTNTPDPPAHVRHMLGWNRKALRVKIPAVAAPAQAAAVEALCELAARAWVNAPPPPPAPAKAAAR